MSQRSLRLARDSFRALERSEIREALAKALTLLEEHYRLAFILRDVNELSITETANILGITRGAVKTRLRRARLMLRIFCPRGSSRVAKWD